MKATITNTSRANQGVWTADGLRFIEPGQTRELVIADDYIERARSLPFLKFDGAAAAPLNVGTTTSDAPGLVAIPDDWHGQHHAKLIALAQRLGATVSNKAEAVAAIEAELAARAGSADDEAAEDPRTDDELRSAVIEQLGEEGAADLDRAAMLALLAA